MQVSKSWARLHMLIAFGLLGGWLFLAFVLRERRCAQQFFRLLDCSRLCSSSRVRVAPVEAASAAEEATAGTSRHPARGSPRVVPAEGAPSCLAPVDVSSARLLEEASTQVSPSDCF